MIVFILNSLVSERGALALNTQTPILEYGRDSPRQRSGEILMGESGGHVCGAVRL